MAADGGAVNSDQQDTTIINSQFYNNCASDDGGAIYMKTYDSRISTDFDSEGSTHMLIVNCSFTGNTAGWNGGAIMCEYRNNIASAINCTFTDNKAGNPIFQDVNGVETVNCIFKSTEKSSSSGSFSSGLESSGSKTAKQTPKIIAKKAIFKVKAKIKKYNAILKTNSNKAMKKVKLYLKIKGKTYTAKTSSKGKATFKIKNLKKKGTYKATVAFKGDKNYNKVTKTVKIIVK